jgi:hypothetical protein
MIAALLVVTVATDPAWLDLAWDAPAECPIHRDVASLAAAYAPDASEAGSTSAVTARARVTVEDARWQMSLALETRTGRSTSEILGESCEALARAAALKIAVAWELDRSMEVEAGPLPVLPEESNQDPPPKAAPTVPAVSERAKPPPPTHEGPTGALRAEGGVSVGALPGVGGGAVLTGALIFRQVRLELGASIWPARHARLSSAPEAGGDFALAAAHLRVCPELHLKFLEFPVCLGVEAGGMRANGVGLDESLTVTQPWAAALFAGGVAFRVHRRVRLGLEVQSAVAIIRPTFHIEDEGRLHRAASADARGLAGIEVSLGREATR